MKLSVNITDDLLPILSKQHKKKSIPSKITFRYHDNSYDYLVVYDKIKAALLEVTGRNIEVVPVADRKVGENKFTIGANI